MKMQEYYDKIDGRKQYRVHFEWHDGNLLRSDYFPERGETAFVSETTAWSYAKEWAETMGKKVANIYVVNAEDWCPVEGYREKMLNIYPEYNSWGYDDRLMLEAADEIERLRECLKEARAAVEAFLRKTEENKKC